MTMSPFLLLWSFFDHSMEELPKEEVVAANLVLFSGDIYRASDCERFLEVLILDKPDTMRCICWLVGLGIIPGERGAWMPSIMRLLNQYKSLCQRFLSDCFSSPLDILPDTERHLYESVVSDKSNRFREMCLSQGLSESSIQGIENRIKRLFTLIVKENPRYSYMQGTENLLMVCLLLTLSMTSVGTLGNFFAEAIAYHLTLSFFSICYFNKKLFKLGAKRDHCNHIIEQTQKRYPHVLDNLHSCGVSVYSMLEDWEVLMFSTLHCPDVLYLLLDSIIVHRKSFEKYMTFLILSHMRQLSIYSPDYATEGHGMNGNWNVIRLLSDAETMMNEREFDIIEFIVRNMFPCLSFLVKK